MKVRAIIQARMGSVRLKGKSLMAVAGVPLVVRVIGAAEKLPFVNEILVATTDQAEDDALASVLLTMNVKVFRGSALNVLERFHGASADMDEDDCIVRITADNPLNNAEITQRVFDIHKINGNDYTYIDGLSHVVSEFVKVSALRKAYNSDSVDNYDCEHVTPFFRKHPDIFKTEALPADFLGLRSDLDKMLTIDTMEDLRRFNDMAESLDIFNGIDFDRIYNWLGNKQSKTSNT